jgi:kynurenine formamidase
MSVLATDTTGTEPLPFADPRKTTHAAMLVERGVHLIENVFLDDLARDGVAEAAFICTPLKLTGCTGSWVRPIAIA